MRLQLRLQCLQMRARQLARANFRAPIETQRVCGSHDHDVDRDFDAGEMEKIPTGWRWLERRFCLRSDRKSTRLNSSHVEISYAVFCLKKKIQLIRRYRHRYQP